MGERLPAGQAGTGRPGRTTLDVVRDEGVWVYRCEIEETGPGASHGWYIDATSETCVGAELVTFEDVGSEAELLCPE